MTIDESIVYLEKAGFVGIKTTATPFKIWGGKQMVEDPTFSIWGYVDPFSITKEGNSWILRTIGVGQLNIEMAFIIYDEAVIALHDLYLGELDFTEQSNLVKALIQSLEAYGYITSFVDNNGYRYALSKSRSPNDGKKWFAISSKGSFFILVAPDVHGLSNIIYCDRQLNHVIDFMTHYTF